MGTSFHAEFFRHNSILFSFCREDYFKRRNIYLLTKKKGRHANLVEGNVNSSHKLHIFSAQIAVNSALLVKSSQFQVSGWGVRSLFLFIL